MQTVRRYHPILVTLHWLLAFIIIVALFLGAVVLVHIPNSDPMKLEALRSHMIAGVVILVLMALRFTIRQLTAIPAPAPTGSSLLDRLARISHRGFYPLVLSMAVSGLVMAFQAHLPQMLLLGQPGHLPASFWVFPTRGLHFLVSRILMTLITLHIAGVLYHTLVRRDHLLRRMWFGKRRTTGNGAPGTSAVTTISVTP